jgi:hypothetical protein
MVGMGQLDQRPTVPALAAAVVMRLPQVPLAVAEMAATGKI